MRPSPSILLQVAGLVLVSVLAAQATALGVLLLAPPPPPPTMTIDGVAAALRSPAPPAVLRRRVADAPPAQEARPAPLSTLIAAGLADALSVRPASVRVTLMGGISAEGRSDATAGSAPFTVVRRSSTGAATSFRASVLPPSIEAATLLRASGVALPPFKAAVRRADGRWTIVEPHDPLFSPARLRMLAAFGLSLLALAPLVWWSARRLTRPVRLMAEAAERLGTDPASSPLPTTSGPAEVREAARAFNRMRDALLRHADERATMTAAIAHDLRTPLTSLRLRAEVAPEPERSRMVEDIARMERMIVEALSLARGDHENGPREACDLSELAAAAVEHAAARGLDVRLTRSDPAPVRVEPEAVLRALANLVDNACRYGGRARVGVAAADRHAVVTVEDDGGGPAHADLERLFEPFIRGEPSRNRDTGGAGLGLTSARRIARRHGGEVVLRTRQGSSALTAVLTLPLGPAPSASPAPAPPRRTG